MRMLTKNLKPGQKMASGETVVSASLVRGSAMYNKPRMKVVLQDEVGKVRIALWNYGGTVSVKE